MIAFAVAKTYPSHIHEEFDRAYNHVTVGINGSQRPDHAAVLPAEKYR